MASPKKRARDLNKEPELDEDYDCDQADLNKEADTGDDAKQEEEEEEDQDEIEAEKKKAESEDEDATQDDESNFRRNRAPKELKAREDQDDMVTASFAISHLLFLRDRYGPRNQQNMAPDKESDEDDDEKEIGSSDEEIDLEKKEAEHDDDVDQGEEDDDEKILAKKRKMESEEEDDSELNLSLLRRWETPLGPPENTVQRRLIEQCSRPIRKQLTVSDVSGGEEQSRLALSKSQVDKKFAHLLGESRGKGGIRVSVYGPDGNVHEMKMWADENSHYLAAGWRKFVGDYELREFCDFVTIWMFRHRDTQQICLAIDTKRFSLTKQVSKRISEAAFEDSD